MSVSVRAASLTLPASSDISWGVCVLSSREAKGFAMVLSASGMRHMVFFRSVASAVRLVIIRGQVRRPCKRTDTLHSSH